MLARQFEFASIRVALLSFGRKFATYFCKGLKFRVKLAISVPKRLVNHLIAITMHRLNN